MANLLHQHPNEGWAYDGSWWVDLNVYLNWQSGNSSNITIEIVTYGVGGVSQTGSFNGQLWMNGGLWANSTNSYSIGSSGVQIAVASGTVNHDVNGYLTIYLEYYANMPTTSMSRRGANYTLPRIPLAPANNAPTSSNIAVTSATLSGSVANNGHGTSSTIYLSYKKVSDSTWIDLSGGTPKNLTGLTPGTQYQIRSRAVNNNGDGSGWVSGSSFTTLPAPNTSEVLLQIVGVL